MSPERRKAIPAPLRVAGTWWNEDDDRCIVGMYFPETLGGAAAQSEWEAIVRRHYPDQWEKATGGTVQPGESPKRDRENFNTRHANDFVEQHRELVDENETHDDALLRVTAHQASTGHTEDFLVPLGEAKALRADAGIGELGQENRLIVDAHRHPQAAPRPKPILIPATCYNGIVEPTTPAGGARLEKHLAKTWRRGDGRVETTRDILARGVTAKNVQVENGVRKYSLHDKEFETESAYSVIPVSKVTFDAVQAPVARSERDRIWDDARILEHKLETATHTRDKIDLRKQVLAARKPPRPPSTNFAPRTNRADRAALTEGNRPGGTQ